MIDVSEKRFDEQERHIRELEEEVARLKDRQHNYEAMFRDITAENDRLAEIEAAAKNLLQVKGRHHTVEAYLRLEEVMK